ncbi:TetR/AcrR family transcriptional regulator [Sporolactobacillus sp. CPB3-1]|uniref:TetR/AcrR family transcriptional regulator n=1 Tax=Sporolactobacillus mangiferae TaxID=2940498 RepID=A0ABT0MD36_9BACL|nr:TetR/AcrR family transcriptional regulator [Sporolactobacillus mangiferae]MCL1632789.1 TetR/AcrR family transcriptional regulator [Sporolactobacillus mangiferae]
MIRNAVFDLTSTHDLVNLSISKIAAAAGISKSTVYVYFKDKEELLSKTYMYVKDLMDEGITEVESMHPDLEARLGAFIRHFVTRFQRYPKEARFMEAIQSNPSMVSEEAHKYAETTAAPIYRAYKEIIENPKFVRAPAYVYAAFFSLPMKVAEMNGTLNDLELESIIRMVLNAMKVRE